MLLFPTGQLGWHHYIPYIMQEDEAQQNKEAQQGEKAQQDANNNQNNKFVSLA